MKKLLAIFAALCASQLGFSNLIENGDFKNGWEGYGFSDNDPSKLNVRVQPFSKDVNSLTYASAAGELGGFNLSEVWLDKAGTYNFTFRAKASKPVKMRLIGMGNGNTIYRVQLYVFDVSTEWKTYTYKLEMKKFEQFDNWVPFRFEKMSKDAADISFADFNLEPVGAVKTNPPSYAYAQVVPEKGKKNTFAYLKNSDMTIRIASQNSAGKKIEISWKFKRTTSDETLDGGKSEVEIPSDGSDADLTVKAPSRNGVYILTAEVAGKNVLNFMFAVTPKVRTGAGILPVDTGYCGVLTNGETGAPDNEEMAFLADSGISYIRTWDSGNPFNWRVIEPEEGKFFWDITDATVKYARRNGLQVLPVLGGMFFIYPPEMGLRGHRQADWLYAKSEVVRPMAGFEKQGRKAIKPPLADWERMVSAIGERYKGKIRHYEIMNEPNIIWRDFDVYYPYIESAHKILKSIDAKNKVVGLSTTGDYGGDINGFVGTMLKMGVGKFCDIISFHSYGALFEDTERRGDAVVENFKADLAKYGVNVPLWHTELYYLNPLSKGGGDHALGPVYHPGYLIRRYLVDAACGVEASLLVPAPVIAQKVSVSGQRFDKFAQGRYMAYPSVQPMGYVPNEKYIVSAVFAQKLYGMKYAEKELLKGDVLCYKFVGRDTDKAVATIFSLDCHMESDVKTRNGLNSKIVDPKNRNPVNLGKLPDGIRVFDIFGDELKDGGNGVIIPVSPIPVYIQAPDSQVLDAYLKTLK